MVVRESHELEQGAYMSNRAGTLALSVLSIALVAPRASADNWNV
jgi:hypothetical protein